MFSLFQSIPADLDILEEVEVTYTELPGWKTDISGIRTYSQLPENAKKYIECVQDILGVNFKWIGVGKSREAIINVF